ncbi:uncharacterized protein LOC110466719 isoform X2 [Mizuhopecten yessoensis]|uniref:Uncharacterized protein n=1 Tax=Mizuhopecten yessoensis TaxID=6573 RepID=A0A210PNK6_MIZYE|nr:uncharacterized protein LOC110466719 isoform X2 [Mizuhopecten yessoensis]OWF38048.1 hypothetical protein KP79_PYT12802 [Mizuhopecten yessoensis]
MYLITFATAFISLFGYTGSSCTFPTELTGDWISSHKGEITFSNESTHVYNYPMYMSATVNALNFSCDQQSGRKYLLKSVGAVEAFSSYIDAYVCIELYRVSAYKFYYYIGTAESSTNSDYVYGRVNGTVVDITEACNRAEPYEDSTFVTLVKSGAVDSGKADATCPDDLLASYTNITYTDHAGASACSGNSENGCSNKVLMTYTYESCTSGSVFSANGSFHCIHSLTSGSTTYLSVWNDDVTVDDSSTYRFTCLAFKKEGTTIYATEYPRFCKDTTQSSTTVASPGIVVVFESRSTTCVLTETAISSGWWIALIVILVLVVVGGVLVGVILMKKHKNKINMLELVRIS